MRSGGRALRLFFVGLAAFTTGHCARVTGTEPVAVSGVAFFSMPWQVKVARLPAGLSTRQLQSALQKRLDATNAVLSTYQSETELMRFNRAPVGRWVSTGAMLTSALRQAQEVSVATNGAYDITVAPLVNLWGFGPGVARGRGRRVPTRAEIAAAKSKIGYRFVEVDAARRRARRRAPVSIDLSSVGEGVAVEEMADGLRALGIRDFLIAVAGVLRSSGARPDGRPWRLAVERPDGSGAAERLLALKEGVISTSGSYRNYFERDGVRYSHTIDPSSGRPITHRGVSLTVVFPPATDATLADAWATALNVLGPERGLPVAEERGIAAYYIEKVPSGFRARYSSQFRQYLEQTPRPDP